MHSFLLQKEVFCSKYSYCDERDAGNAAALLLALLVMLLANSLMSLSSP